MRVVTTTLFLSALVGCAPRREVAPAPPPAERPELTQEQIDAIAPVIDSLARALAELAPRRPELAEYKPESAKVRRRRSMGLYYVHNVVTPPYDRKRGVLPSDYGEDGSYIWFGCRTPYPGPDTRARSIGMWDTGLPRLGLEVSVRFGAGPTPREDLLKEIRSLVDKHIDELKRIDGEEPSPGA